MSTVTYRALTTYKYQTRHDVTWETGITPEEVFESPFIAMDSTGRLTIKGGYAWDGASGGMPDSGTNMRSSLVHDALYQAMRNGFLGLHHRDAADRLFADMCKQDGMWHWLANLAYLVLKYFGTPNAEPQDRDEIQWSTVPTAIA